MKTRRLSQGMIEAYNSKLRIRLKPLQGSETALVIIYQLKPNGFHFSRTSIPVKLPITIEEIIETYESLEAIL